MPQFKLKKNDVYHNVLKTHPKYVISYYHNNVYINSDVARGDNLPNGQISLFERNVDRSGNFIQTYIQKGENSDIITFQSVGTASISTAAEYKAVAQGGRMYMPHQITSSIHRDLVKAEKSGASIVGVDIINGVTEQSSSFRVIALKNTYNSYRAESKHFNFDQYIFENGGIPVNRSTSTSNTESLPRTDFINMISIPSIFYGSELKKGSLDLNFYYTGSLLARAQDINKNGELVETVGPQSGSTVGVVLYNEGILLLTASYQLHSLEDGYLSPRSGSTAEGSALQSSWVTQSSWAHFGAYESYITSSTDPQSSSYAPASSSYTLEFQGTTKTPVLTVLAHAPRNELNWSNNPTFIEKTSLVGDSYEDCFVASTGAFSYVEKPNVKIKNTISSSYNDFTESYKPQTFISKIGIYDEDNELIAVAKLARPVRKTNDRDYTFKLKLDL